MKTIIEVETSEGHGSEGRYTRAVAQIFSRDENGAMQSGDKVKVCAFSEWVARKEAVRLLLSKSFHFKIGKYENKEIISREVF